MFFIFPSLLQDFPICCCFMSFQTCYAYQGKSTEPDVIVHVWNPSTYEAETRDGCEFEVS